MKKIILFCQLLLLINLFSQDGKSKNLMIQKKTSWIFNGRF